MRRVIDNLARDTRFSLRMLRRQPGTAATIVLTLALGIGSNAAIFAVVEAVVLRPLPVSEPHRLVLFSRSASQGTRGSNTTPEGVWGLFSNEAYDYLRARPSSFASVAAFASNDDTVSVRLPGPSGASEATPIRAVAQLVSGNYFGVMGAETASGRTLTTDDDRPGAAPVVVVSNRFWRNSLQADPAAVGRTLRVNNTAFAIVGVMPGSFFGERVRISPDAWVPLIWQPDVQQRDAVRLRTDYYWLSLMGRLAPGRSLETAEAEMTAALRQFVIGRGADQAANERLRQVRVEMMSGARGISVGRQQQEGSLTLLLAAVGLVLLIACANVATLLLCRAASRSTEGAVRRALGASRLSLVRQWLTESVILGLIGAGVGSLVAAGIAPWLLSFFPAGPVKIALNVRVLGFTTVITVVASIIFGLAPAIRASRAEAVAGLRAAGRGTKRRSFGAIEPFVIAQIAVSLLLVVGSMLFLRTIVNMERSPLGFDRDDILLARIDPRFAGYTQASVGQLYRRLYEQASALPGVESATFARYSPFSGYVSSFSATIEGYTPAPGEGLRVESLEVGPNYPQTIGMPVIAGRAIGPDDISGRPLVMMVNEAFVKRFMPAGNPVGRRVQLNEEFEIVGVVKDALFHAARDPIIPFVFTAMFQESSRRVLDCELELRVRGDADAVGAAVRQMVRDIDAGVVVRRTGTLHAQVRATFGPERLTAGFVSAFAGFALLIAAVGLSGVVAYGIARRVKEIGVRLALGATRADVLWLIVKETMVRLGAGIAIGAVATAIGGRFIASRLFGIAPGDAASFALAAAILAVVALLATLLPAAQALRIHPATALRAD